MCIYIYICIHTYIYIAEDLGLGPEGLGAVLEDCTVLHYTILYYTIPYYMILNDTQHTIMYYTIICHLHMYHKHT